MINRRNAELLSTGWRRDYNIYIALHVIPGAADIGSGKKPDFRLSSFPRYYYILKYYFLNSIIFPESSSNRFYNETTNTVETCYVVIGSLAKTDFNDDRCNTSRAIYVDF